jgi:hypothetical protein
MAWLSASVERGTAIGIGGVAMGVLGVLFAVDRGEQGHEASALPATTAVVITVPPPGGSVPVVITIPPTTTPAPETDDGLNPLGGNDPEDDRMPDVVCMDLQAAQDEIQDHGVFLSRSEDATGEGRRQIWDRNWVVVRQSPAAGASIDENEAVLYVVKDDEPNDC